MDGWLLQLNPSLGGEELEGDRFVPLFAIHESPNAYEIECALPRTKRDDIMVKPQRDAIEIRCARAVDDDGAFGAFTKQLALGRPIDVAHVETTMRDGVLVIRARKAQA